MTRAELERMAEKAVEEFISTHDRSQAESFEEVFIAGAMAMREAAATLCQDDADSSMATLGESKYGAYYAEAIRALGGEK